MDKVKIEWRGPVIVIARMGIASDNARLSIESGKFFGEVENVTAHDLRDVVDIFCSEEKFNATLTKFLPVRKAKAVRVNCPGHLSASITEKFIATSKDTSHPVFGAASG